MDPSRYTIPCDGHVMAKFRVAEGREVSRRGHRNWLAMPMWPVASWMDDAIELWSDTHDVNGLRGRRLACVWYRSVRLVVSLFEMFCISRLVR